MKRIYLSSFVVISLLTSANAISLKKSVQESLLTNNEILSNNLNAQAAKKDIRQEKSGYYPSIDLDTYYEKSETKDTKDDAPEGEWESKDGYRATLSVEQLVYDGGKTPSRVDEKEHLYKSKLFNSTYKNEDIILNIVKSYNDIVKNSELSQIIKFNQDAHAQALEIAYNKEEISGEVLERKKTQAMISNITDKKLAQDNETKKALSEFQKYTGIKNIDEVCRSTFDESLIPSNLEKAIELALKNNAKIKEQEALVKKQKEKISQESADYKPVVKLKFEGSYDDDLELVENGVQKEVLGQVKLNWNFYSGGSDKTASQKEKLLLLKEKKTLEKIKTEIIENVTNLYQTYIQTKNRIKNFDSAIEINKEILEITRQQLEDGTKTFLDDLSAKSKVLDAQSNKIKQEFILMNTYYELLNEFALLGKTILTDGVDVCNVQKVKNLIEDEKAQEESLDSLLDESVIDNTVPSEVMLDDANTSAQDTNTTQELPVEDLGMSDDEFDAQLTQIFEDKSIDFNKNNLTSTFQISGNSFTKKEVNKDDRFHFILGSFSLKFLKLLNENKDKIKDVQISSYTSSEHRRYDTEIEKYNANIELSQRRANKVKEYFAKVAIDNQLDPMFVNTYFSSTGKGPIDIIRDDNGVENRKASRRIVIQVIKK